MNPLEEARDRLGAARDRYEVRVLEPSPPAVTREPFTDDPTARGVVLPGRTLVAPVATGIDGDLTWDELARDDPDLAAWCAPRALGAWTPPPPLPASDAVVSTRLSLHALAEHVLCAARFRANGKIGLRFTRRGFGTPFFGADEQVRIEGTTLVHTSSARDARFGLTTLAAAAAAIGIEPGAPDRLFEPTTPLDLDRPLDLDEAAVAGFGWWYGLGAAALAQLRADAWRDAESSAESSVPSFVQLWPEHFDIAVDLGDADAGTRANFGASPGDAVHPEPYLYVGPWDRSRLPPATTGADPYWNEDFGASLPYSALEGPAGPREIALEFFRTGRDRLAR